MINRRIELPARQSFFLLGPRQTGKTTLIRSRYPKSLWTVDLLQEDLFMKYSKSPSLFRGEALEKVHKEKIRTICIDEVQRVPVLLNEVQALMAQVSCQFILTGSSARKLKRGGANLLAGRAAVRHLFPLLREEIGGDFRLGEALRFGTLPALLEKDEEEKIDTLSAYANTYLREEIQAEGIVRNLGGFSRFLDLAASQSGELLSFSAVARECQLPTRTVQSYYEILEDTLLGFRLEPWRKSLRKRLVAHPKFYLFDLGVTNAINQRLRGVPDAELRGRLFEQFLVLETYRTLHYCKSESRLFFWQTNHGAEVDLLIERHGKIVAAFEIKASSRISGSHLSGIRAFREQHSKTPCAIVCTTEHPYEMEGVRVLPWERYLEGLSEWL